MKAVSLPRPVLLRRLTAVLVCAATAVLIAACGSSTGPGTTAPAHRTTSSSRDIRLRHPPTPLGRRPLKAAEGARVAELRRKVRSAMKGMGTHTGALVADIGSAQELYAHDPAVARRPASVEKIYTTVSLLDLLKPDTRLRTQVLGTGHLGRHGVWYGNLYLKGGGDPTFGDGYWNKLDEGGYGPTASDLATDLSKRGIRRVTGLIYGDESLFDTRRGGPATHNKPDIPDYQGELSALVYDHGMTGKGLGPAQFATREVALTMQMQGIKVHPSRQTRKTPPAAKRLATVYSPPLRVMVRLMDVPSDDLFADLFAKQLGAKLFGQGTLAGGSVEIRQLLASRYDIHPVVFDGSGLDYADRTSPAQVVSLLRETWGTPVGRDLYSALPVVGREGTVQEIGLHTYAAGHCVAKTGTLNNVTNLAGYCHARGGKTVAFALFIDGPSNWQAVTALSKAIGAVASY